MLSVLVKRHPFGIAGVEKVQHAGADRSAVNLMHGTRVGGQLRTVLLGSLDRTALLYWIFNFSPAAIFFL